MTEQISIPFSWDDLCDTIHYVDWKVQEVDDAGCELEHPNIRNVLKRLEYIKSRMTYNPTDKVQDAGLIKNRESKIITYRSICNG